MKLDRVVASELTIWPVGFDAEAAGVVLAEDPGAEPEVPLPAAAIVTPVPVLRSISDK